MRKLLIVLILVLAWGCDTGVPLPGEDALNTLILGKGPARPGVLSTDTAYLIEDAGGGRRLVLLPSEATEVRLVNGEELIYHETIAERTVLPITPEQAVGLEMWERGRRVSYRVIPPGQTGIRRLKGGNGKPHALFQGTCREDQLEDCAKLTLAQGEIVEELRQSGDVYIFTATVNISNENRYQEFYARLLGEYSGLTFNKVFAESAGAYMLAALSGAGVLEYEKAYAFVGPYGGVLPEYTAMAERFGAVLLEYIPEFLDYRISSQFYKTRVKSWCESEKNKTESVVRFISLEYADTEGDLLLGLDSQEFCASGNNLTRFKSNVVNHYNYSGDQETAGILRDIVSRESVPDEYEDVRLPQVVALMQLARAGELKLDGLDWLPVEDDSRALVETSLNGIRILLDFSSHSVRIDGVDVGYFDNAQDFSLAGMRPLELDNPPPSIQAAVAEEHPDLKVGKAYILFQDGKLRAFVQLVYRSGSLRALFTGELAISQDRFYLRVRTEGSVVYNVIPGGLLEWRLDELSLEVENGKFSGVLRAKALMRVEFNERKRAFEPHSFDDLMRQVHGGMMGELALSALTGGPFSYDPLFAVGVHIIANNTEIKQELQAELETGIELIVEDNVAALDVYLSGDGQGKLGLLLFGLELGKLAGDLELEMRLISQNLAEYAELKAQVSARAGASLLFLPIVTGAARGTLNVRANFDKDAVLRARADLNLGFGVSVILPIFSERAAFSLIDYGRDPGGGRFHFSVNRNRWDLLSDSRIKGHVNFNLVDDKVDIVGQYLKQTGRGAGLFPCDSEIVAANGAHRLLEIPGNSLSCYMEISINVGYKKWRLAKIYVGSTKIAETVIEF